MIDEFLLFFYSNEQIVTVSVLGTDTEPNVVFGLGRFGGDQEIVLPRRLSALIL